MDKQLIITNTQPLIVYFKKFNEPIDCTTHGKDEYCDFHKKQFDCRWHHDLNVLFKYDDYDFFYNINLQITYFCDLAKIDHCCLIFKLFDITYDYKNCRELDNRFLPTSPRLTKDYKELKIQFKNKDGSFTQAVHMYIMKLDDDIKFMTIEYKQKMNELIGWYALNNLLNEPKYE